MKLRSLFYATLVCPFALVAGQGQSRSVATTSASDIPHLRKQGSATQLIVDGKPFLVLAGELSNNSATSLEFMKAVWPRLVAQAKLNTVLAGVSWAQIEPQEGKFDFSVLDGVIQGARSHNLRLVLLWFGSWKNGLSSYPPDWVKKDFERFPRSQMVGDKTPWPVLSEAPSAPIVGRMNIELLSTFSEANWGADARAFAALMRHVKEVDGREHTVIMVQVENEVGMQGDTRDRLPAADKAFAGPVPKELMDYLVKHRDTLIPEFRQVWEAAGFKTSGTWEEVFGQSIATDEIFMAWSYARYVGRVAEAGKAEYPLPMYVNAALHRTSTIADAMRGVSFYGEPRGPGGTRGGFAIGGPMDDMMDVWRAGAPRIDILSPDAYTYFQTWCPKYTRSGNPLLIPEARYQMQAKLLYVFGRYDAIGFSLMGVERSATPDDDMMAGHDLITQLAPLISEHQGKGTMSAVLLGLKDPPQKVQVGNYTVEAALPRPRATPGAPPPQEPSATAPEYLAAAIFIATGPDEFYVAGRGVTVTFTPNTPGPEHAGLGTVEDGKFVNGRWVPGRRLAGDDDGQGQYLNLRNTGIQRVTLYRYR